MALLVMTPSMVAALGKLQSLKYSTEVVVNGAKVGALRMMVEEGQERVNTEHGRNKPEDASLSDTEDEEKNQESGTERQFLPAAKIETERYDGKPSLLDPTAGNPISHGQLLDLIKQLNARGCSSYSLDILLRGSKVYISPPPPKPEPTSEYKALMARLRREEESRAYERMINPPPPLETFSQRFPTASAAHAFSSSHQPTKANDTEDDDVTYADINRQIALILNILVSIVACAGGIWMAARWWSTPARLALSMSGSMLVGIAEVVVYAGYIRRVGEAKGKAKNLKEIKEVMKTWVIDGGKDNESVNGHDEFVMIEDKEDPSGMKPRKRKKDNS